jgi:hypothetical protein
MYLPILAGLCFGLWPLLMRLTGLTGMQGGFLVSLMTLLLFIPLFGGDTTGFTWKTVGLALAAGVINWLGSVCLQKGLAGKQLEVSVIILVIIMTQVVVTAVGTRLIYGELWDLRKLAGMIFAALAVWLLTSK